MASNNAFPEEDDSINLESKVLLALKRLQKRKNCKEQKPVSCNNVVRFLKAHYSWLDGDIQSQVKTALLSLIKNGTVCILDNSKYRLLTPSSKTMNFTCSTRIVHSRNCCCLFTLKDINCPNICCLVKNSGNITKKIHVATAKKNKKKASRGRSSKSVGSKNQKDICDLNTDDSLMVTNKRKKCETCNSKGGTIDVPTDIFSPRDEVREKCK